MQKTSLLFTYVPVWRPVCGFLLSERTRVFSLFSFFLCICWTFSSTFCLSERYRIQWIEESKHKKKLRCCVNKFNQLFSRKKKNTALQIINSTDHVWKRSKCFLPRYAGKIWKMQQSPVVLGVCLRKTLAGNSLDYRDVIAFEKLCFQNVSRPH